MNEQELLYTVGSVFLSYAAVVGTASVVAHSRVNWRASAMGRHLMFYMAVMAATLDLGVIRFIFGDSHWFQVLRTAVFIGVPIVMTQRLILQIKARRKEDDPVD